MSQLKGCCYLAHTTEFCFLKILLQDEENAKPDSYTKITLKVCAFRNGMNFAWHFPHPVVKFSDKENFTS